VKLTTRRDMVASNKHRGAGIERSWEFANHRNFFRRSLVTGR